MNEQSDLPIAKERLQHEKEICSLYIDSAKTYVQLSTGALLLSLAFSNEFLGEEKRSLLYNLPYVISWASWLISILAGATYQYCAIKYLETLANEQGLLVYRRDWPVLIPKFLQRNPFVSYGVMMSLFYLGIVIFSCVAIYKIVSGA